MRFRSTQHQEGESLHETRTHPEVSTQHAQLDLYQLMTMGNDWSHPTQALPRPIAPYDALLEVCAHRLETAEEKGDNDHLRYMHERLRLARDLSETARLRRVAMALGIPWDDEEARSELEAQRVVAEEQSEAIR